MATQQATVPALIAPGAISRYLETIRKVGLPDKVDLNYLKSVGFKNSNDRMLVALFKSLGFLDSGGKPTEVYRNYKGASAEDAKAALGQAVKKCYAGLFQTYPDAARMDDEALNNWIRANNDAGEDTRRRALSTFKALRDAAKFDESTIVTIDIPPVQESANGSAPQSNGAAQVQYVQRQATPEVTINITLQIAPTNDATIYDKFFASMKKHLFPDESK